MRADGIEWGEDYRRAAGAALKEILECRMAGGIDRRLEEMARRGAADRRNGSYQRWPMTELGEIALSVPRTRTFSALAVVCAYARRAAHIDRLILACFVLGLSTRKAAIALLPFLDRRISAATVSQVAKNLDAAVAAFHRRPLADIYSATSGHDSVSCFADRSTRRSCSDTAPVIRDELVALAVHELR